MCLLIAFFPDPGSDNNKAHKEAGGIIYKIVIVRLAGLNFALHILQNILFFIEIPINIYVPTAKVTYILVSLTPIKSEKKNKKKISVFFDPLKKLQKF